MQFTYIFQNLHVTQIYILVHMSGCLSVCVPSPWGPISNLIRYLEPKGHVNFRKPIWEKFEHLLIPKGKRNTTEGVGFASIF